MVRRGWRSGRLSREHVNQLGLEVVLVGVLILINGILSGSELAIVSARRHRLQQRAEQGDEGARRALELAAEPNRFLSIVQVGITSVGILAGVFGGATIAEKLAIRFEDTGMSEGVANALAVASVVIAITYLSLVFGELVPKRLALAFPERIASTMASPLSGLGRAGAPVVGLLSVSTEAVLRVLRVRSTGETAVTAEELRMVLLESTRAGVIEEAEQEMASAALRLGDRSVSEVMTPRVEVTWLDVNDAAEATRATIAERQHHWFPVVDGDADTVLGVVAVRDLFTAGVRGEPAELRRLVRPVGFVPESISLVDALERMRLDAAPLAVVVDEYGGTNGIVTLTDIVGAVVGDFASDPEDRPDIVERGDGSWLVDGRVGVDRLAETLDLELEEDGGDFQTLAGLVLHSLGRIPAVGDRFEAAGFTFEVVDMDARRVDQVLVTRQGD